VLFSIILRHSCPENSYRLLPRRTDYRRSPQVCTLPFVERIVYRLTCIFQKSILVHYGFSLSSLSSVWFHIVLGVLVLGCSAFWDHTRTLPMSCLPSSTGSWLDFDTCHSSINLFCISYL
jgi:hypothetical protein